jgi:hypothetical protein
MFIWAIRCSPRGLVLMAYLLGSTLRGRIMLPETWAGFRASRHGDGIAVTRMALFVVTVVWLSFHARLSESILLLPFDATPIRLTEGPPTICPSQIQTASVTGRSAGASMEMRD